jgi:hypothetical protein
MTFGSSWTWGQKNHMGDFFIEIPSKKRSWFFVVPCYSFLKNSLKSFLMEFDSYSWENLGVNFNPVLIKWDTRRFSIWELDWKPRWKPSPLMKSTQHCLRGGLANLIRAHSPCVKITFFFLVYLESALPLEVVSIMFCKAYHHFSGILIKRAWFLLYTHHWYGAHLNFASPWSLLL